MKDWQTNDYAINIAIAIRKKLISISGDYFSLEEINSMIDSVMDSYETTSASIEITFLNTSGILSHINTADIERELYDEQA